MSDEQQPSVEVVKYDRAMLEPNEVQPVSSQDGHTITVNRYGQFAAKVGEVEVAAPTLEQAKDKVHRAHMAQQRKLRKKVLAVPAFILVNTEAEHFAGDAFFRGIHAGNGQVQWSLPDGSKGFSEKAVVFRRDTELRQEIVQLMDERAAARAIMKRTSARLSEIEKAQREIMLGQRPGWGRIHQGAYVHNDAEKANEIADMIVANALSRDAEGA